MTGDYSAQRLRLEDLFERQAKLFINIYDQDAENVEGVITESDLKTFFRCPYAYYLKRHVGMTRTPKSARGAMALLFQQARKSLFNLRTPGKMRIDPYETRGGPDKKLAEEMTEKELRRYMASTSAEAFGNTVGAKWMFFTDNGRYAGSPLALEYEKERFTAKAALTHAARNYFEFAAMNGAPILGFINTNETVEFNGHLINAMLPEVKRGMIIDEPTMWGVNTGAGNSQQAKLDSSTLVTLRIVALCTVVRDYGQQYEHKLRIPAEIADEWNRNRTLADPRVRYRHYNATEDLLLETHRDASHIDELKRRIDQFLEGTSRREFPPNHARCYGCQYNVAGINREVACRHANPRAKPALHILLYNGNGKNGNGEKKADEGAPIPAKPGEEGEGKEKEEDKTGSPQGNP